MMTHMHKFKGEFQGPVFNCKHCNKPQYGTPYHLKELDSRAEYNPVTRRYYIYRPATDERPDVEYSVDEQEVLKMVDPSFPDLNVGLVLDTLAADESVDAILRPIQRRAAIEHSRRLSDGS